MKDGEKNSDDRPSSWAEFADHLLEDLRGELRERYIAALKANPPTNYREARILRSACAQQLMDDRMKEATLHTVAKRLGMDPDREDN